MKLGVMGLRVYEMKLPKWWIGYAKMST